MFSRPRVMRGCALAALVSLAACGGCGGDPPTKENSDNADVPVDDQGGMPDGGGMTSDGSMGGDMPVPGDMAVRDMAVADMPADMGTDMAILPMGAGLYVSGVAGNDANTGAEDAPFASIGAGIAAGALMVAGGMGPVNVIVAGGPSTTPIIYSEKVVISEGVSVLGGHDCVALPCTWTRDPNQFHSVIANIDFEGVLAGAGITRATFLNGLRVRGMDGDPPAAPGSAGITVNSSAPTISGNVVTGGTVNGGANFGAEASHGIVINGPMAAPGPLIERNQLMGGSSSNVGSSLQTRNVGNMAPGVAAEVRNNTIVGPMARHSVGIRSFGGSANFVIANNQIDAGNSPGGGGAWGIEIGGEARIDSNLINSNLGGACINPNNWCGGIISESSTTTITNNVIFGLRSSQSTAVMLAEFEQPAGAVVLNANYLNGGGTTGTGESAAIVVTIGSCTTCGFQGRVGLIRNNIFDGGVAQNRFGLYEDPAPNRTMVPDALEANAFFGTNSGSGNYAHYRSNSGTGSADETNIANVNAFPFAAGLVANLEIDCMFDATNFVLPAGSMCIDAGVATEAPRADRDGDARPMGGGIDLGPDEIQ